jgi:spermidine synthase
MLISLFALTIFTSAYLLFQVQPLISKFILPWFGGSPTVWTTAMLFFQCVLFGGYVYAHFVSRHGSPWVQKWIHLLLLIAAAVMAVFVLPGESMKPMGNEEPIGKILLLLGASVGLPYFVLATTGPLLQYWFVRAGGGGAVFRLYALSNVGSFIALLSFPYLFEPFFELPQLGRFWTYGFWAFAILCATVVVLAANYASATNVVTDGTTPAPPGLLDPPSLLQRLLWVGLPALASLAFIATTDHVSHDIAPEPRLWIATLSLYLLTFILSFDHPRWYQRKWIAVLALISIVFLSGRNEIPGWFGQEWDYSLSDVRWTFLSSMFLVCFMSHGELYRLRPTNPRYLTEFYLWMSFGGACGGLFVALVATNFFSDFHEWPLYLVAAIVLASTIILSKVKPAGVLALILAALVLFLTDPLHMRGDSNPDYTDVRLHQSRNFYGTVSVMERRHHGNPVEDYRVFYSGQITHGMQYLDASRRRLPVTYYGRESGVGETLGYAQSRYQSVNVAIIGLGAGTLATYARPSDDFDFYEINPDAAKVADQWFDNVSASLARSKQVIIGDARLKMEQLGDDVVYDVIVLDAFNGGAVPIHLLTREAFQIYRHHLRPDGFIAINITNGYLNLYPVVKRQAEALNMGFRHKFQSSDPDQHIRKNMFFILTNDRQYLQQYPSVSRKYFNDQGVMIREDDPNIADVPLWTDHFSSLTPIELKD